jgi:uncharacterized protein
MPDISYPGVYIEELPSGVHSIAGVHTSVTAFVGSTMAGPVDQPTRVRSFTEFERAFGDTSVDKPLGAGVRHFFLNGGSDAIVVRAAGPAVPRAADGTGIYALDAVEGFNLLCLPDLGSDGTSNDLAATANALAEASRMCEDRRAILIVDPLPGWQSVADVVSGPASLRAISSGMRRANAAMYFPRVLAAGRTEQAATELPPSGAIAGIIARTDGARGVWKAPTGQDAAIVGIGGLASTVSPDEARSLAELGVNPLRTFPGVGNVVWGARTLDGATGSTSDWRYVPVRRTALYLEESLYRGLQWVVFEPNDDLLWAAIRMSVGAFMAALRRQGAFQGNTPRMAYFVRCGRDTTTQEEIDLGIVRVVVGFAPLRPAEFVVIDIRLVAGNGTGQRQTDDDT